MADMDRPVIFGEDVFVITDTGNNELRGAATSLSPSELELLVHIDGKSTVAEIKARMRSLPPDAVVAALRKLSRDKLIAMAEKTNALDFVEFFNKAPPPPSPGAITEATAEASTGTSMLEKEGYYVRIVRRATSVKQLARGQSMSVVVIEDDPDLVKYLKQFLTSEGFDTRVATNRVEIVAELSRLPLPDLVLLDVMLPDADGFEILLKMRQHPALKAIRVVMLTGKATRDAVINGLAGGADGYITKPFETEVLSKAIKTVLGLPPT